MQSVLERGSIDNPLTFDVGLIQLTFIPVCLPNYYYYYYYELYSHMTGNDVSDGNKRNVEGSELG